MASFGLRAAQGAVQGSGPLSGFFCAAYSVWIPFNEVRLQLLRGLPLDLKLVEFVSLLVSGLVNPVFLTTVFLILIDSRRRMVVVLRLVIVGMIPFSWLFFATSPQQISPREGHALWVAGMLLVLFADEIATGKTHETACKP
jgi:hypothetical protein